MKQRELGITGTQLPIIGQGTWQMEQNRSQSVRALRSGIDSGMIHIDTAEMYASGAVEELVGEAIAGRRHEVFLVSKVLPHHGSAADTIQACESSLQRLGTDYLDLYLLHWRGSQPLEETVKAFVLLQEQGKICRWGVSNFDIDDLIETAALVGPGSICCNQVLYHLDERYIERKILPWCQENNVALVGYSPFGSGSFPKDHSGVLKRIAQKRRCTPHQVALSYLVRGPGLFTIPKASRVEHVLENASAGALELSEQELHQIQRAFSPRKRRKTLPMV